MKVKELIEKLQKLNPELEIVGYESDMERSGVQPVSVYPVVQKFKTEKRSTWDRFDYTDYTYTRYVEDPNGPIEAVRLW